MSTIRPTTVEVETRRSPSLVGHLDGVHDLTLDRNRARFSVDPSDMNQVLGHLVDLEVRTLTCSPPTLEELFLRHYGDVAPSAADQREVVRSS